MQQWHLSDICSVQQLNHCVVHDCWLPIATVVFNCHYVLGVYCYAV